MPFQFFTVEYLCSLRPVWRQAEEFPETTNAQYAMDYARALCIARRGNPVRVVTDAGRVVYTFTDIHQPI